MKTLHLSTIISAIAGLAVIRGAYPFSSNINGHNECYSSMLHKFYLISETFWLLIYRCGACPIE
ncbi:MAG: hypothetical protein AUI61_03215 [Thaumarchaeota archaeon 13_1_40CM_2_39_13_2]|nr:MAG: hypothetical protein AUI61_03215 [Thaumarchaeota archaeon 13_1_40CM_2_39_13_2]OLE40649.1 MAG: hypothetical protein AUG16_03230 [Thaumarchaeota archaeon 13_1_20CM_2_39_20]